MSLQDLRLPNSLLVSLYGQSLVGSLQPDLPAPAPVSRPASPLPDNWKKLGNNQKHILIVVNYADSVHLPDEELSFLTSMLAACKLSLDDVAVINLNNYRDKTYKPIVEHFEATVILLFGIEPAAFGLPVNFPPYQVQGVAGATYLYSQPMEDRHADSLLKSKLWVYLRRIFNI